MALVSMLVAPLLDVDGDAQHLRVVRRRVRHGRKANRSDVPGVILFEIDGLGEAVLREAVRDGHVPTIARWLADGTHKVLGWECDLSSQTGASQAGLLLGSNWDMPAFRWYEKESGRTLVSNHPADAAEIERRRSSGKGLLAADGTSRGNMFSGDAPRCTATMSVIRDRTRSKSGDFFAYFSDPYGFLRTIALSLADIAYERSAARRQRRSGAAHVERGGAYPLIRAAIAVVMRDLNVALLMADIVEGVPVSYATFVGYDEVAHHSGIRAPDALAVLGRHDRQLERLERAVAQAPRPYNLVVLSDHGQTQGAPFRARYGVTLEQLVGGALARGQAHAPAAVDEAWGDVGAVLADARQEPGLGGRALARATRGRAVQGTVALGPNREALAERGALERDRADTGNGGRPGAPSLDSEQEAIVMVSGPLGLIYLPRSPERLTLEQISQAHPALLDTLTAHPGIGFAMVRSRERGTVAIGAAGRHWLADEAVEGEDPLAVVRPARGRPSAPPRLLSPLPGHPRQQHVRPGRGRGCAVRGVHGLARRARRSADAPLRRRAGAVARAGRADRRRGGDARSAARLAGAATARRGGERGRASGRLDPRLGDDAPALDRPQERLVVVLALIGVNLGEVRDRAVEDIALTEI